MSPWALPIVALACGGASAVLVRAYGSAARTRSLWWVAALAAGGAALLGSLSPVPAAAALAGIGLAAAAVIDAVETRIPSSLAHGTTCVSGFALVVDAWRTADWALAGAAVAGTVIVVVVFLALWLAGGMGFGDVRLAASTVTASVAGVGGAVMLLWGAFAAAGVTAVLRWRRGGGRAPVPFGPALAVGWVLAVVFT